MCLAEETSSVTGQSVNSLEIIENSQIEGETPVVVDQNSLGSFTDKSQQSVPDAAEPSHLKTENRVKQLGLVFIGLVYY